MQTETRGTLQFMTNISLKDGIHKFLFNCVMVKEKYRTLSPNGCISTQVGTNKASQ